MIASVFIALGSNMGDSETILRAAIEQLATLSLGPIHQSSLWQTTPVNCPAGSPPFVNAVIGIVPRADETPETLLGRLHIIEKRFGRKRRTVLNEPRRLDLDLIAFSNQTRNTPALILPHPRAHQRRFVLQPLSEIAPKLILPGQRKTVSQLLATIKSNERLLRLKRADHHSHKPST